MRKIQLLGVAMLALFAFGALTAVSASAAFLLAEWLLNGAAITAENLVEISGELLLEDSEVPIIGKAAVLCSGLLDGWVGPNSLDHVSEVLTLGDVAVSNTPLTGESLSCTAQTGCETNTTVEVWPIGMPWESEVELLEQETPAKVFFADLLTKAGGGVIGWEVSNCLVLGVAETDECTATEGVAELRLEGTTSLGNFSSAFTTLAGAPFATCTQSGRASGLVEGEGTFVVSGGGELAASSETSVS